MSVNGPHCTVDLRPTDALAIIDAIDEATSTGEYRPFAQALGETLRANMLRARRAQDRDSPDGDYSEAALRVDWSIKEIGRRGSSISATSP